MKQIRSKSVSSNVPYRQLEPEKIGLSLAEGKDVLHRLQTIVVAAQAEEVCMLRRFCTRCHRFLELKDRRIRKVDTVFGTAPFRSARIVCCPCETRFQMEYPYNPMTEFVPERATAELLSLEAMLSAQMPYRQVVAMMRGFLPVRETLNHVTVRNRALRAGARVEAVHPAESRHEGRYGVDADHRRRMRSAATQIRMFEL